jgi:flagellar biosynthesis/type III secretory pathway protein FliH
MTRTLILEDFGAATTPPEPTSYGCSIEELTSRPEQPDPDPDPAGLEAFEQGYQSGWDDCIANETEERRRIGADLAGALSEMSLTAETAQRELLASIAPVIEEIAFQLLPRLAAEALAPVLIDEISSIVLDHGSIDLQLHAAPEKCETIEAVLQTATTAPITVVAEPAFAEGQVSIRFAEQRRDVDLSEAVARMSHILREFASDAGNAKPKYQAFQEDIERGVA